MGLPALGAVLQALQPADPGLTRTVPGKRAPRGQTLREGLCGSGARAQGPSARQASSLTSLRPASPRRCPSLTDSRPRRSSHGDLGRVWTRGLQCGPLRGGRPGTRALGPSACWGSGPRSAGSQPGPTLPAPRGCRPLGGWAPAPAGPAARPLQNSAHSPVLGAPEGCSVAGSQTEPGTAPARVTPTEDAVSTAAVATQPGQAHSVSPHPILATAPTATCPETPANTDLGPTPLPAGGATVTATGRQPPAPPRQHPGHSLPRPPVSLPPRLAACHHTPAHSRRVGTQTHLHSSEHTPSSSGSFLLLKTNACNHGTPASPPWAVPSALPGPDHSPHQPHAHGRLHRHVGPWPKPTDLASDGHSSGAAPWLVLPGAAQSPGQPRPL